MTTTTIIRNTITTVTIIAITTTQIMNMTMNMTVTTTIMNRTIHQMPIAKSHMGTGPNIPPCMFALCIVRDQAIPSLVTVRFAA